MAILNSVEALRLCSYLRLVEGLDKTVYINREAAFAKLMLDFPSPSHSSCKAL
jgi:hypothetical protein